MRLTPTSAEATLWRLLRRKALGVMVHRQSVLRGYVVDFYVPAWRLAIEVDGPIHNRQKLADARRDQNIELNTGIRVIRFTNAMVEVAPQWVVYAIKRYAPAPDRRFVRTLDGTATEGKETTGPER